MLICASQIPLLKCHHHFIFSAINIVVRGCLLTSRALVFLDTLECEGGVRQVPKIFTGAIKMGDREIFSKKKRERDGTREGRETKQKEAFKYFSLILETMFLYCLFAGNRPAL